MRFLPIVTQIFLWSAVFAGMRATKASASNQIAGYSYQNFVAYYLLAMIARAFSSMPGLAAGIARQIRDEVRRPGDTGINDKRVEALRVQQVAHELKLDAFGVERAEQNDGHSA